MGEAVEEIGEPKSKIRFWSNYFGLCQREEEQKQRPWKFTQEEMTALRFIKERNEEGFRLDAIKCFLEKQDLFKKKVVNLKELQQLINI